MRWRLSLSKAKDSSDHNEVKAVFPDCSGFFSERRMHMKIVPYEEKYRKDVQRICVDTGSPDNQVNAEHRRFTLLMYCDEYLDHETGFVLLDDHDVPQGYVLCAENYGSFQKHMKPYLEKIRKECPSFANRTDISEYEQYQNEYPAHLHIDIEEDYTGHGRGTALIQTLLDHLKRKSVKGIMLGVDKHNERAFSFYQKTGFHILKEDEDSALLGLMLR